MEAELLDKGESLARIPGQGHRRTDHTKAHLLFFPVYSYLIATGPLQILAIVPGAREFKKILKQRKV